VAVIMSNPEQSKHLETARMKVGAGCELRCVGCGKGGVQNGWRSAVGRAGWSGERSCGHWVLSAAELQGMPALQLAHHCTTVPLMPRLLFPLPPFLPGRCGASGLI